MVSEIEGLRPALVASSGGFFSKFVIYSCEASTLFIWVVCFSLFMVFELQVGFAFLSLSLLASIPTISL